MTSVEGLGEQGPESTRSRGAEEKRLPRQSPLHELPSRLRCEEACHPFSARRDSPLQALRGLRDLRVQPLLLAYVPHPRCAAFSATSAFSFLQS